MFPSLGSSRPDWEITAYNRKQFWLFLMVYKFMLYEGKVYG
jgi:hypothetical protein